MKKKIKNRIKKIKNPWKEGVLLDRWSYVHFLVGVCSGFLPLFFDWDLMITFVLFCFLAILYEFLEYTLRVKEYKTNRVSDVAVASVGFMLAYLLVPFITENKIIQLVLFLVLLATALLMNFDGWRAYKKYGDNLD